ncbi:LlaJI family restriction endonuclease [Haloferula sp.]|uniref:LlaJI family restriction endonuclease n=1 Tax=Haloferula sp. TaxID=2497595 RepID=UPI003C7791DA
MKTFREGAVLSRLEAEANFGVPLPIGKLGILDVVEDGYRIRFVGWWTTQSGELCCSLPKVFPDSPSHDEFNLLVRTIRKEQRQHQAQAQSDESTTIRQADNLRDLFEAILSHTEQFGWHTEEHWIESEELAHANWERTADECVGSYLGLDFVFPATIGTCLHSAPSRLAPLQALALQNLEARARPVLEDLKGRYESIISEVNALAEIASEFASPRVLIDELLESNRDHDRALASLLDRWLRGCRTKLASGFSGTSSFAHTWERAVRACILGSPDILDISHSEFASQPIARDKNGNIVSRSSSQRPDLWCLAGGLSYLIDAKWYDEGSLPPTPDIIKQLMYELSAHHKISGNVFIVPTKAQTSRHLTSIRLEYADEFDERFPLIRVIELPTVEVLASYINCDRSNLGSRIIELMSPVAV